jgi:YHS domain-containing protein
MDLDCTLRFVRSYGKVSLRRFSCNNTFSQSSLFRYGLPCGNTGEPLQKRMIGLRKETTRHYDSRLSIAAVGCNALSLVRWVDQLLTRSIAPGRKNMSQFAAWTKRIIAVFAVVAAAMAFAASDKNVDANGVALKGYDPVAYFVDGKPTLGMDKFMAKHDGAVYLFASEKNRDEFVTQPEKFAPQYGGFCAYGAAKGGKYETDPTAFTVVEGKLYLNKNASVQKLWTADVPGFITQADTAWPQLKSK